MKTNRLTLLAVMAVLAFGPASAVTPNHPSLQRYTFPAGYLNEPDQIPDFWVSSYEEVMTFMATKIKRGTVRVIGTSAGGRPIHAVFYGEPRRGAGTSTFSGALGFGNTRVYRGPDHDKKVLMIMAAVHGGEFESIVGAVNLISIMETGKDLRGKEQAGILARAAELDRLIIIPIVNVDGRTRIPLRMEAHVPNGSQVHEYFNTGGFKDGTNIGWPQIKEHIPLDFSQTGFPGGYPNDNGVNIQHDDFFGHLQPETQALFDLAGREKPDVILNLHTGAPPKDYYARTHRYPMEPELEPVFTAFNRKVHSSLALAGLQSTRDPAVESDPKLVSVGPYNLNTALGFHCGALTVLIESPSHAFSAVSRSGEPVTHTPEMLLDAQLVCHLAAMEFLAETGGRAKWTSVK